jgi:hypothetical protein
MSARGRSTLRAVVVRKKGALLSLRVHRQVAKKTEATLDPQTFAGDLERALAVLSQKAGWLTAAQISTILRDRHGISLHWRRIMSLFRSDQQLVGRRKREHRWQYTLLAAGRERLSGATGSIMFVDPTKAVQATLTLHNLLQSLNGTARICDPYLDPTTVDHLSACSKSLTIRLLTKNVRDAGRVRALLAAAKTEGWNVEVRVAGSAPLHDRYIIDDGKMLILGTSLNGFGKKQGFVVQAGHDIREVVGQAFDTAWAAASAWS